MQMGIFFLKKKLAYDRQLIEESSKYQFSTNKSKLSIITANCPCQLKAVSHQLYPCQLQATGIVYLQASNKESETNFD